MNKKQITTILLLTLQMFLIKFVIAIPMHKNMNFKCPETSSCSCSYVLNDFEIECPPFDPNVIIKVLPEKSVTIECIKMEQDIYRLLPKMNLQDITNVNFRRCPLPKNSSIQSILFSKFQMKNIRSLVFLSYGADLDDQLTRQHLSDLNGLDTLVLSGNGLTALPANLFLDITNITWLDLRSNKLILPFNIFSPLKKLEYIELGYNNLTELPMNLFKNQQKLKQLNLWENNLRNLTKESFLGVESITDLDLSSNNIEKLPSDIFSNLINLNTINLNGNYFKNLPENLFSKNKNLTYFRLMDNRISLTILPSGLLANLTKLEDVRIRCNLHEIPGNLFTGSSSITNISFAENELETLPSNLFSDQIKLLDLDLSSNKLQELDDYIFTNTNELLVLDLSHNQLQNITMTLFSKLIKLNELYLNDNNLHNINSAAFHGCKYLEILHLENNKLSFLDAEESISFTLGSFEVDRRSPFDALNQLKILNLRNNSLTHMLQVWSYNNINLQELDLSYNNVTYITYNDLQFLSPEIYVNLSNNFINEINFKELYIRSIHDQYLNSKITITLNDNPLHCDCLLLYFIQFLRGEIAKDFKTFHIIADQLKCNSPIELANKSAKTINTKDLLCPLDSPNTLIKNCPKNCICLVRPVDLALIVNCSNSRLKTTNGNDLILPNITNLNFIKLYIENMNLTTLPTITDLPNYQYVKEIYANNNNINYLIPENIPNNLTILELSNNNLKSINSSIFDKFNKSIELRSISLGNNPWICDCSTKDLLSFIQLQYKKISDLKQISCSNIIIDGDDGNSGVIADDNVRLLSEISYSDLCTEDQYIMIASSITIAILGLIIGIIAALYYKFQQEIKIWLFAHNLCLWFVTEEELDKDKKYDAFISYSHKDEDFISDHLVPELETGDNPFKLCIHVRDFVVGEFIPVQIAQSVEDSRRTIVVLSPNFLESVWARLEFRQAHNRALSEGRARVIVIIYGNIGDKEKLEPELKAYLDMNTYVQWGDPWFWKKLRYAMPHPEGYQQSKLKRNLKSKSNLKNSIDDKLELIKPVTPTEQLTTPPADLAIQNPLETTLKNNDQPKITTSSPNGKLVQPNNINGHINGAFIINSNAKQSDV